MKKIIVAYDKKLGIGADNDLLWQKDLPSDLKHFKDLTNGHAVIMGRNTFESIHRPLPNRQNIVISRSGMLVEGFEVVDSLEKAFNIVNQGKDAFVIGGGQIYNLALNSVDQIYATEVDAEFKSATIFFPALDLNIWHEVSREKHFADDRNLYNYDFVIYERNPK